MLFNPKIEIVWDKETDARVGHPGKTESVQPLELFALALKLLGITLNSCGRFTLPNRSRLLVKLPLSHLGKHTRFLAGSFEPTQSNIKRLVFFYSNIRHV